MFSPLKYNNSPENNATEQLLSKFCIISATIVICVECPFKGTVHSKMKKIYVVRNEKLRNFAIGCVKKFAIKTVLNGAWFYRSAQMDGQSRSNSIFAGGGATLRAHSQKTRMERDSIDPWTDRSNGVLPAVLPVQMER